VSRSWITALVAILHVTPALAQRDLLLGPSGGHEGNQFTYAIPSGARIAELRVHSGDWIDGLQIVYIAATGERVEMPPVGGSGGGLTSLQLGTTQYIRKIYGRYGTYVDHLSIETEGSKASGEGAGPDFDAGGGGGGADYTYEVPPGMQIVGFYGRAGQYLDAIGVIVRPR
jgi:hypothetical protein